MSTEPWCCNDYRLTGFHSFKEAFDPPFLARRSNMKDVIKHLEIGLRLSHSSGLTLSESFREHVALRKWSDIALYLLLFWLCVQPVVNLAPERFHGASPWLVCEEQTLFMRMPLRVAHEQVSNAPVRPQVTLNAWGRSGVRWM